MVYFCSVLFSSISSNLFCILSFTKDKIDFASLKTSVLPIFSLSSSSNEKLFSAF
jgi:hypothetical protein